MAKDWKELKAEIEKEMELVSDITKEPQEIMKIRLGIITSDAGSYGQYFSVLVSLYTHICALGQQTLYTLLRAADEDAMGMDTLRIMTRLSLGMNSYNTTEFIAYLGIKNVYKFAAGILDVLDQLKTKEEYKEIMSAYWTYVNYLFMHVDYIFPWPLGIALYPKTTAEDIKLYQKFLPIIDKITYF